MTAVITRPTWMTGGFSYSRVITCSPGPTATPRKAPSAFSTGAGRPSTSADHPGNQASATTTSDAASPTVSIRHRPGPCCTAASVVADGWAAGAWS